MKPSILLTGASGFIGKPLYRALIAKGYRVYKLRCRLQDHDFVEADCKGMTIVIHCAAEIKRRHLMDSTNILGTMNLFFAADRMGVETFVHIGTASTRDTTYTRTKREAERIVTTYPTKMKVIVVRPPTLYGGKRGPKWLQGLKLLLMGRPMRLQSREQCVAEILQAAGL